MSSTTTSPLSHLAPSLQTLKQTTTTTTTTTPSSSTVSPLLKLPTELRFIIYTYLFTSHDQTIVPKRDKAYQKLEVFFSGTRMDGVLSANCQTYGEATNMFYTLTIFIFEPRYITIAWAMETWIRQLGPATTTSIRRIAIVRDYGQLLLNLKIDTSSSSPGWLRRPTEWARDTFPGLRELRLVYNRAVAVAGVPWLPPMLDWKTTQASLTEEEESLAEYLERVAVTVEVRAGRRLESDRWVSTRLLRPRMEELSFPTTV